MGEPNEPWTVLKADSGDGVVFSMCVPAKSLKGLLPRNGVATYGGAQAIVEIRHRAQGPTESPSSEWQAWITWRGHARLVPLDALSVCSRCGRVIVDIAVSPDGQILIGH